MDFLYQIGLLNPASGWRDIFLLTAAVVSLLVVCALCSGSLGRSTWRERTPSRLQGLAGRFALYIVSAHVQQLAFFAALYVLRAYLSDAYWITIAAALGFAALHLPNWFLMWPTAFMATILTGHMDVYHNLFAVAVAHGMVGSAYEALAPRAIPATFATFGRYIAKQQELVSQLRP